MEGLVEATQIISIIVFLGTTIGFFIKIGEYKSIINTKLLMLEKALEDLKLELKETKEEIENKYNDTKEDINKLKTETTFVTSRLETLLIEVKTKLELLMQFQGMTNQNAKPKN